MSERKTPSPLSGNHFAFLIPGIGISYTSAIGRLKDSTVFGDYCSKAGIDRRDLFRMSLLPENGSQDDSLENQKIAYAVNCSMCDLYRERGIRPVVIIGYSMGIYAALYAGGYFTFETGLAILEHAYNAIEEVCSAISETHAYGMGAILGLTEAEIRSLVLQKREDLVEIAIYNGKRSHIVAGRKDELELCLQKALEVGALKVIPLKALYPYHTRFLERSSLKFSGFLQDVDYLVPHTPVLSWVDGECIEDGHVKDVLDSLLFSSFHFDAMIRTMVAKFNIITCFETGPAFSMKKLVRYINRKIKVCAFEETG